MATNTPNYNLIKPAGTDPVNIADLNNNADIIDTTLKSLDDRILPIATQSEAQIGNVNNKFMTPLRVKESTVYVATTETNLNNLYTLGNYSFVNSSSIANTPIGLANGLTYLMVISRRTDGADLPTQLLFQPNGQVHHRGRITSSTNTWSAWTRLDNEIATQAQAQDGSLNNVLITPLRLSEALRFRNFSGVNDFNGITNSGRYYLGYGLTTNTPPGYNPSNISYLEVLNRTTDVTPVQRLYQPYLGLSWSRSKNGNTESAPWTPWKIESFEIATQEEAQAGTDNTKVMTSLRTKQAIDNSPISRYGTATGTNALIITANPLFDNLYTGLTIKFKNTTANTGNVTANINSKGVKSVVNNDGTQIKPGKLKANSLYEITYDGTNFYLTKGGGEESPISKVTRGSTTISSSSLSSQVTLPQFNVNKSVVKISVTTSSASVTGTSTATNVLARIVDDTTISFTRNATSINNLIVYWELIQYEDYVNVQKGISDLSTNSLTVPISTVNADKSVIYFSYDSSTNGEYAQMTSGHLNSSSELLFRRGSDTGINKISWFVVEIA